MLLIHRLLLKQPKMCGRENILAQKINKSSYRPHSVIGCLHEQLSALGCHFFTCIFKWAESVISKVVSNCKSPWFFVFIFFLNMFNTTISTGERWMKWYYISHQFSSVQSLSHVRLFATPWITARQASLSITYSQSSLRLTSMESVIPSSHLILCHPLLLLPPIPPSIRIFSNESTLRMRWPKYWSFSFSIIRPWNIFKDKFHDTGNGMAGYSYFSTTLLLRRPLSVAGIQKKTI